MTDFPHIPAETQKQDYISKLWELLRAQPIPAPRVVRAAEEDHGDYMVESLELGYAGTMVRGFLTRPKATGRHPAILYAHAHGRRYDIGAGELLDGRAALRGPLGPVFARAGFVTLCIDMPCFGARSGVSEDALVKQTLWRGHTVMGQMLSELSGALSYLNTRPDVDAERIGAFGISMGATHAYMLAGLDARIKAVAHLCCYADFETLIDLDHHDLHGHYLTIPGFSQATSVGQIAGLVAPRPQLICNGTDDPLTPPSAIARAYRETEAAYQASGSPENLRYIAYPDTGHTETDAMRDEVMAFFATHLGQAKA